jgi:N-methylhydantoinase A
MFFIGSTYGQFPSRLASQPPFANTATLTTSTAQPLTLQNGFPVQPSTTITNSYAIDRNYALPYVQSWNFTVEKRLASDIVATAGLAIDHIDVHYELDMHYLGQTHTVSVPLALTLREAATGVTIEAVTAAFEASYQASFSRLLPGIPVRIVNLRTTAIGVRPRFDLAALGPREGSLEEAARGNRRVWFDGGWHATKIWDRLSLPAGARLAGPAIIEQNDATTVLDPGLVADVDGFGNLLVTRA